MPEDCKYRKHTSEIVQARLQAVSTVCVREFQPILTWQISNIKELEKKIDCGQIEEVIVQVGLQFTNGFLNSFRYIFFQGVSNTNY